MTRYYSKIGWEMLAPILIVLGIVATLMIADKLPWPPVLIPITLAVAILYIFLNTYYDVGEQTLKVRAGFLFNSSIDIGSIARVKESNNILSSPAASLDRLEIKYGKNRYILISPKQKQAFIDHLLQINPAIEVQYRKKKDK